MVVDVTDLVLIYADLIWVTFPLAYSASLFLHSP